jgi:hypothetical protein
MGPVGLGFIFLGNMLGGLPELMGFEKGKGIFDIDATDFIPMIAKGVVEGISLTKEVVETGTETAGNIFEDGVDTFKVALNKVFGDGTIPTTTKSRAGLTKKSIGLLKATSDIDWTSPEGILALQKEANALNDYIYEFYGNAYSFELAQARFMAENQEKFKEYAKTHTKEETGTYALQEFMNKINKEKKQDLLDKKQGKAPIDRGKIERDKYKVVQGKHQEKILDKAKENKEKHKKSMEKRAELNKRYEASQANKKVTKVNDAIIKNDGSIIHTSPDDNIIATKNLPANVDDIRLDNTKELYKALSDLPIADNKEIIDKLDKMTNLMVQFVKKEPVSITLPQQTRADLELLMAGGGV